jgi:two-component system, NarL family, invasion response regulator UvrY
MLSYGTIALETHSQEMSMIKLVLIDDHTLVRDALKEILATATDIRVIGEAGTGEEGVECVHRLEPDLILLDLQLPDMPGLEVAKKILQQDPQAKILVVSAVIKDLFVFRLIEAGAAGYISKHVAPEELFRAIKIIHSGQRFISPKLANRLTLTKAEYGSENVFAKITEREWQVLRHIIRATPVKEIAQQMGVGYKTVHSYRDRIFAKLGVDSDLSLTLLAINYGLLTLDSTNQQYTPVAEPC